MMAQLALKRHGPIRPVEETVIGAALDLLAERGITEPIVPDLLQIITEGALEDGTLRLQRAAQCFTRGEYRDETRELRQTLAAMLEGSLAGMFDGPTTTPFDMNAPMISVDVSAVAASGDEMLASALVAIYAYGFACVEAANLLSDAGLAPPQRFMIECDEFWSAMRGAPGIVKQIDAMMRLGRRGAGVSIWTVVHSLLDMEALATVEDRAMARGFIDRAAAVIVGGLSPRDLELVNEVIHMTGPEQGLVERWSGAESWVQGSVHPGRGNFLIKCGGKVGLPVHVHYVGDEGVLYFTDPT
jgi:hypothetical protein